MLAGEEMENISRELGQKFYGSHAGEPRCRNARSGRLLKEYHAMRGVPTVASRESLNPPGRYVSGVTCRALAD